MSRHYGRIDYDEPNDDELFCYSQGHKAGEQGKEPKPEAYEFPRLYTMGYRAGERAAKIAKERG